jgi:lipopolysaccharide export system permease protein
MGAPRILWRYLGADVLRHALLALGALTLVVVVQSALGFLGELLEVGVGIGDLARLVAIVLPGYLPYAIPAALVIGVLVSFGRMSADGEVVAMRAAGIGVHRMLPPVLLLALGCSALCAYIVSDVEPRARHQVKSVVRQLARDARLVRPGEFRALGDHMVYVQSLGGDDCPLSGVLIGDFSDERRSRYVAARCGAIAEGSEESLRLDLVDGSIHFGETGSDRYRRLRFERASTQIDLAGYLDPGRRPRDHTTAELVELDRAFRRGEKPPVRGADAHLGVRVALARNFAFPFASLALALLAVPLGVQPLRAGRSFGVLTALVALGIYWCLAIASELAAGARYLAPEVALWIPNATAVAAAVILLRGRARREA